MKPGDRWLGPDGTIYDVVRPAEVGDRPRWWIFKGFPLEEYGPTYRSDLHDNPVTADRALVAHVTCHDLDAVVDGELENEPYGRELAALFQIHLPGCARCREMLEGRMQEMTVTGLRCGGPSTVPRARFADHAATCLQCRDATPPEPREANLDGSLHVEGECCGDSWCRRCDGRQHTQGAHGCLLTLCEDCACDADHWRPRGYYRVRVHPRFERAIWSKAGVAGDGVEAPCGDLPRFAELPPPRAAAFVDHLPWCRGCREAIAGRFAAGVVAALAVRAS